jgi:acyl carrier protein
MPELRPTKNDVIKQIDQLIADRLGVDLHGQRRTEKIDVEKFGSIDLPDTISGLEREFGIDFSNEDRGYLDCLETLYSMVYSKYVSKNWPVDTEKLEGHALVIPVYNHASRLNKVLSQVHEFKIPVFVVDDGSTDDSFKVASYFQGITVLRHDTNRGKGAALLTGFTQAAKVAEWAITLDADGQHEPLDVVQLIEAKPEGTRPIVVGHRQGMRGQNVPWTSRFGKKFSNFWVRTSKGPKITDSQSGFRIYPLPEVLNLKTRTRRFQYEIEVLALANWVDMPVVEAPVSVNYWGKHESVSHFRPCVDFWRNAATFTRLICLRLFVPRAHRARLATREIRQA